MFGKNPEVPVEEILFWTGSGSDDDIRLEAGQYTSNVSGFSGRTWKRLFTDCDKHLKTRYKPVPWATVIEELITLDTGVGQPWKQEYSNKAALLAAFTEEGLIEYLERLEADLLSGGFPVFTWDVFSKLDKYKKKKLDNNRLRTIQGSDVMYLMLLLRWMYPVVKDLYRHERYYVVADNHDFAERVTKAFAGLATCGLDATGFDRCIPGDFIAKAMSYMLERTDCPEEIQASLIYTATNGPLQLPWGEDLPRDGGNPSGIFLTTILNCMFNDLMHIEVYLDMYGDDFLKEVRWLVTGDDSIDGFVNTPPPLSKLVEKFSDFGLEYKVDGLTVEGQVDYFPRSIGCHAPYLSKTSVVRSGVIVPVPSEPRRNLGKYDTFDGMIGKKQRMDSLVGIRESLMPYYACRLLDAQYPIPYRVQNFMEMFDRYVAAHGFDTEGLMTASKALEVYGTEVAEGGLAGQSIASAIPLSHH